MEIYCSVVAVVPSDNCLETEKLNIAAVKHVQFFSQYSKFVKPAFEDFILPTKKYADIIIPRGGDNHVAIDLIVQHIRTKLGQHDLCKIYPNLYAIQTTFQVKLLGTCSKFSSKDWLQKPCLLWSFWIEILFFCNFLAAAVSAIVVCF